MPVLYRAPLRRYLVGESLPTTRVTGIFKIFALCLSVLCAFVAGQLYGSIGLPIKVRPVLSSDPANDLFNVSAFTLNKQLVNIANLPALPITNGHYLLEVVYFDNGLFAMSDYALQYASDATAVEIEIIASGGFFINRGFVIAISIVLGIVLYPMWMGLFYYWRDDIGRSALNARVYAE